MAAGSLTGCSTLACTLDKLKHAQLNSALQSTLFDLYILSFYLLTGSLVEKCRCQQCWPGSSPHVASYPRRALRLYEMTSSNSCGSLACMSASERLDRVAFLQSYALSSEKLELVTDIILDGAMLGSADAITTHFLSQFWVCCVR